MNFRKKIQSTSPGFQMAPMLDIVFILLIHFMAATLFAKWEHKLEITVPTASSDISPSRYRREVIINIDKAGVFYINSISMNPERLNEVLRQLRASTFNQPIVIRADQDTPHKYVVQVLDLCTQNDIRNVAFSTIKPSEAKK